MHALTPTSTRPYFALVGLALLLCTACGDKGTVIAEPDAGPDGGCPGQLTCADYAGAECGVVSDGCGGTLDLVADCGELSFAMIHCFLRSMPGTRRCASRAVRCKARLMWLVSSFFSFPARGT